jgi:hypothetical protein
MAGADLTPIYYLASIAGTAGAGVMGARAYMSKQRDRWISEGTKQASLADKLDANTTAAGANTAAVERLSRELHDYAARTETQLNGHASRLDRLEGSVLGWRGVPGGS